MLLGFSWLHAQLTGTYNITGNPTPGPGEFTTIQQAFNALMSQGVGAGGVTFVVQESWRTTNSSSGRDAEPPTIPLSTYPGAGPGNPVTLTFAGLSGPVYFAKSPNGAAGDRFIFRFTGSVKYFTLDGAGKLILKSTATGGTSTGLIGFVSTSSLDLDINAITIQNVVMHGNERANTFSGVYIGQDASLTAGTVSPGSTISAITIQGCTIDSVSRPIFVAGRRTNTTTTNISILEDTLGHPTDTAGWCATSEIGAIHIRGTVGVTVRGNIVHPQRSTNHSVAGIRLDSCEAATIERNWIKGVVYLGRVGYGAYGIALNLPASYISPDPQTTVLNNMIAGIYADGDRSSMNGTWVISGIWVTAPSPVTNAQVRLIHNSINLFDDPVLSANPLTSVVGASSGITLGFNIRGGVVMDGNLIQNRLSPRQRRDGNQAAYGILIYNSSLPSSTIDYQCYRINANPANNYIGCLGNPLTAANNHPTLSAWQTAISGEANGRDHTPTGDVPFLSDTNLHLNSSAPSLAINAGNPAYNNVAIDFDGQTRPLPNPPGTSVNNPPDPGTAPDIGADELDGTPFSCPSSLQAPEIVVTGTYPPLAGSDYLWGQQVEIDTTGTNSPTPSGTLNLIYSLNGGQNWIAGPPITSFPVIFTLPPVTPPNYTPTMLIAVRASAPAFCNLTADTSDNPASINLTDRPGNRADNAIEITLTSSGSGMWTAPISDSTDGLATTNEYNAARGARWGSASRDLFFVLTLPECLDSLVVNTCSGNTNFDTRIHFINAATNDTITNDDQGSSCTSAGGSVNPNWLSQLVVFGLPNALQVTQTALSDIGFAGSAKVVRDTALLVSGHTLYIVVEGSGSTNQGKFELTITGYKMRPTGISVNTSYSAPVCKGSSTIPLEASVVNAPSGTSPSTYIWEVDGTAQTDANTSTYVFDPNTEGVFTIVAKAVYPNPNNAPNNNVCPDDTLMSDPVTITVEDTARAQIADANDNPVGGGRTLSFTAGSTVTLKALSTQTPDNSYTWNLYNSIPPSGTPTRSQDNPLIINNISAGSYTVILKAVRGVGACDTTRDTVYLSVTTGLRTDAGTFSIFPNPNTGAFTIAAPAMDTYRIQVLDVAGRLVAEDTFTGSTHQMRLSLPAGIYQVRLIAGEKVQVERLIITQ